MASTPAFAATPNVGMARCAAAHGADLKAPSPTVYTLFTADPTDGSRVEWIYVRVQPDAYDASTALIVRLWILRAAVYYLFEEISLAATTPSAVAKCASAVLDVRDRLFLMGGDVLVVGISQAPAADNVVSVIAFGADL